MDERRGVRRITLREAADELGISKDAVRQRIRRKTLRSDKGGDGRVYVYLDASVDGVHDDEAEGEDRLYREMRERIAYLERQVEEEREARRRADTLLARLMDRVPELEAPREVPEAAEAVEEATEGAPPRPEVGDARDELGAERARREMAETTMHEGMSEERRRREEAERERDGLRRELFGLRGREEAHEAGEEQQGRGQQPRPDTPGPQEGARRTWWRRVFGR